MTTPLKPPTGGILTWVTDTTLSLSPAIAQSELRSSIISLGTPVSIDLETVGAGGLDADTLANGTAYAVWLLSGMSGATAVVSAQFSGAEVVKPVGYDKHYRRIGSFVSDSVDPKVNAFTQNGTESDREVLFNSVPGDSTLVVDGGNAVVATLVDCSTVVPPTATDVLIDIAATSNVDVYGAVWGASGTLTNSPNLITVGEADISEQVWVPLDADKKFEYLLKTIGGDTVGTASIRVLGYKEELV